VWFVVGIPIYFYAVLSDGTTEGNRAAFFLIGTFMALWIILYGAVQASAPKLLRAKARPESALVGAARGWALALLTVPVALTLAALVAGEPTPWLTATLIAGLLAFGAIFAVNSALHSYLILAFTKAERVTMDVGFYYMANAAGRLLGTLLSGLSYQVGGVGLCLPAHVLPRDPVLALGEGYAARVLHDREAAIVDLQCQVLTGLGRDGGFLGLGDRGGRNGGEADGEDCGTKG